VVLKKRQCVREKKKTRIEEKATNALQRRLSADMAGNEEKVKKKQSPEEECSEKGQRLVISPQKKKTWWRKIKKSGEGEKKIRGTKSCRNWAHR